MRLFLGCDTQWIVVASMAGLVFMGVDFSLAAQTARWMGIKETPALFEKLRALASEAIPLRNQHLKER